MKSTIKIEFDFETKEPYIDIVMQDSDDLRDKMLKSFFQQNQGAEVLRIKYHYKNENDPLNRIECVKILNDIKK